jgi:ABC-type dipeptide/oligopeptide/nickel transport system permease subunit
VSAVPRAAPGEAFVDYDAVLNLPRRTPIGLFWIRFRRNRLAFLGAFIIAAMVVMAVAAPIIAPYDPSQPDFTHLVQPPSGSHLLGTDDLGRDVLSRIIYGARLALAASILPVLIALAVGVPFGLLAGYFRGFWDEWVIMRVVDAMQAFPFLILALALAAVLGPSFTNAVIAIGVAFIPAFIRIVRGQVLSVSGHDYILSARALGAGSRRIMWAHVLPNTMGPLLVQTSVAMAAAVLAEAGLAFLGVSGQVGTPSWGQMLTVAQGYVITAPLLALWPGLAIFLAVLGFNLLGDGIRDGLDPRLN